VRIAQLNLAYDDSVSDASALLDRYHTLTGLAGALAAAGASVSIVQRFSIATSLARSGAAYRFVSDSGPPMPAASWVSGRAIDAVVAMRPDVVHINGLMFPAMVAAVREAAPDAPIVVQDHAGLRTPGFLDRLRDTSWRGLEDADAWSFTSEEYAKPWRDAGLLKSGARVFEIVEASTSLSPVARHEARAKTGLAGNPLILGVGRLDDNKDPLTVLRGIDLAFAQLPEARCCMVYSDTTLEADVRALVGSSPRLRDRVALAGAVPYNKMPLYYSAADFFVSGSHREGSGYALIEAMACGVVPIVTDIPSFRVIAADCGMRWQAGDARALAEALIKSVRFDRAAERERVRERFVLDLSWHAIGARTVAAYRSLMG
jgi:glycosyltransferase involved in cell wall biosynthesis